MKRIAVICRTQVSLELDDRIRKECISLSKNFDLYIFAIFENNRAEEGVTSYGIPFKSFALKSKDSHLKWGGLLRKEWEFYRIVSPKLKEFDFVWCAEEYTVLFALLGKKNKFIWDLHEIPKMMINNFVARICFHIIENRSLCIVHANDERIEYLKQLGIINNISKHQVVHNYPDDKFFNSNLECSRYDEFRKWLGFTEYVYLQGLDMVQRYPFNTIRALLEESCYKILVVGRFKEEVDLQLKKEFGQQYLERVFLMGTIPSLHIPLLLKEAKFSIVFYTTDDPNSRYCEANRFYNALRFAIPVVVGCNETMANICKKYGVGVYIKTDGRELEDIKNGICDLQSKYEVIKKNCVKHIDSFSWKYNDVLKLFD